MSLRAPADFDPLSPETLANPYPFYEALRRSEPVYRVPGSDYYCVSRYADVRAAVMDTEAYSSNIVALLFKGGDFALTDIELVVEPIRSRRLSEVVAAYTAEAG